MHVILREQLQECPVWSLYLSSQPLQSITFTFWNLFPNANPSIHMQHPYDKSQTPYSLIHSHEFLTPIFVPDVVLGA